MKFVYDYIIKFLFSLMIKKACISAGF